jgi:hypothetical protein
MTPQESNGPRHEVPEAGDPLLVRPFILREQDTSDTVATWPSAQTWPPASVTGPREILSHRADRRSPPPGASAPSRRRRTFVLAAAGAVAVIGLAAAGYGLVQPGADDDDVPIPSGALPPVASPSPGDTPAAPPVAPTGTGTTAPATGRAPAGASASASATGSAAADGPLSAGAVPTSAPGPGAITTDGPAKQLPGLVAALSPAPVAARVGTIAGAGNLCLDLNGGVPVDDNHIQVFTCNGSFAQRWTLATDGTLRVVGRCAQVTADTTVHIIGCDDRSQAQWRVTGGDTLVNVATGECLTDPGGGARSGAGVRVTACAGAGSQRWNLP